MKLLMVFHYIFITKTGIELENKQQNNCVMGEIKINNIFILQWC